MRDKCSLCSGLILPTVVLCLPLYGGLEAHYLDPSLHYVTSSLILHNSVRMTEWKSWFIDRSDNSTTIASPLCVSWHVYGLCCLLLFLCHMTIEWHLMTTLRSWTFLILQGHFMCSRSDVKFKREINKHRNQHRENENTKNKNIFVIYLTKGSFCQCKLHQIKQSLSVKLHVSDCDWLKESFSVHM